MELAVAVQAKGGDVRLWCATNAVMRRMRSRTVRSHCAISSSSCVRGRQLGAFAFRRCQLKAARATSRYSDTGRRYVQRRRKTNASI